MPSIQASVKEPLSVGALVFTGSVVARHFDGQGFFGKRQVSDFFLKSGLIVSCAAQALALIRFMTIPLWSGTNENRDVSTGPLARPFARSLAPLTPGKVNF